MAEALLVEEDVARGREILQLLDEEGMKPKAAFWLYSPDADRWRLIIGTDDAKRGSRELYMRLIRAGSSGDLSDIEFQTLDSPFVKAVGGLVRVEGLSDVRMRRNVLNGVYVHDALVYRMAA